MEIGHWVQKYLFFLDVYQEFVDTGERNHRHDNDGLHLLVICAALDCQKETTVMITTDYTPDDCGLMDKCVQEDTMC